jgi:hypothetical protein
VAPLFPDPIERIDGLYDLAQRLMRGRAEEADVTSVLEELEALLKGDTSDG